MAKTKKRNRKVDSENITNRKTTQNKKNTNPFEVQINREKFQVLGRDTQTSRGRPGASRSKGIQKRKETLGKEYLNKHKRNEFQDKRIGIGKDGKIDDVFTARFMAEKMSQYKAKKKSIYNLNDDEILTHKGQTLEEIEQFQDNASEDDADDEGRLAAEFTESAHFGGGEDEDNQQNRKSAIEELIIESKKRKLEKLKEKEEVEELTTALDEKWKSLIPVMGQYTTGDVEKPKADDYDKMMRELIFEPRGEVSDRLMSTEEILKRERDRLEQLEKERLQRMSSNDGKAKIKHRSADELDDGYFLNPEPVKPSTVLAYGMAINGQGLQNAEKKSDDQEDDKQKEENVDFVAQDNEEKSEVEEESELEDESDVEEASENEEDDLNDLKVNSSSSDEEMDKPERHTNPINVKQQSDPAKNQTLINDLPYTFQISQTYEEFRKLLEPYSNQLKIVIIERMVKSNHPKTTQESSQKVTLLFTYLIQYLNDEFMNTDLTKIRDSFSMLNHISVFLFDLSQILPEQATTIFKELIKEKQENYRKKKKQLCGIEVLVFLKLTSLIFPTTDFRHRVVTPALVYVSEMLSNTRIKSRCDIARGLFLVCLSYEFNLVAKRILPAAFNYLLGIIYLCVRKRPIEILKIIPPFKTTAPLNSLLTIDSDEADLDGEPEEVMMTSQDLLETEIDTDFKIRCFGTTLNIITDMFANLSKHCTISYYTSSFVEMLERIDETSYPKFIQTKLKETITQLTEISNKPLQPLIIQKQRPKALRMIQPKFEKMYDGSKKFSNLPKEKEEKQKLLHKIKRETKGAIREIRRDNEFIAKINLKQQIQSDMERKEKVKRIYAEASIQQGELNALDRSRKKKK